MQFGEGRGGGRGDAWEKTKEGSRIGQEKALEERLLLGGVPHWQKRPGPGPRNAQSLPRAACGKRAAP